jgi:hypothetical protein
MNKLLSNSGFYSPSPLHPSYRLPYRDLIPEGQESNSPRRNDATGVCQTGCKGTRGER